MKKYTQPQVEITAFDFEDITMSSLGADGFQANKTYFSNAMADQGNVVIDASGIEW